MADHREFSIVRSMLGDSVGQVLLNLLLLATTLRVLTFLVAVVYNLFFHPLRHFPGPKISAATILYHEFFYVQGKGAYHERWMHDTYGPVVRQAPNTVFFVDPQAWKDIYGHRTGGKLSTTKPIGIQPAHEGHSMLEFIPSDEEHGQRRRIYAHAFSDQAIRKQEPGIKKHIHKLVVKLEANARQAPDEPQDLVQWLHFTTFDIMGELAFGENLGMLDDAKYIPWVAAIVGSFKAFIRMHIFSSHQPFGWLFKMTLQPLVKKKIDDHRAFAAERVNKRLAKEIDQPDIWNLVINAKPERLPSRWAMQEDGMLFMQAGTDTSASALSGMFYYLLKNPDKQAKLVKEIRDSFHSLDDITGDKLARLPYLSACLEEGMRLYPPASNAFERFAPPGGMMVCGEFIPEGMKVGIPHFAAYRFADNWSLPDEFHPERWMGKDSRFANDKREVLQPFLYGPRNCLGKNLAYNEMRLIVAYLIVSFDIEHTKESENWFPHEVYALWQKPPMKLKFTPVAKA